MSSNINFELDLERKKIAIFANGSQRKEIINSLWKIIKNKKVYINFSLSNIDFEIPENFYEFSLEKNILFPQDAIVIFDGITSHLQLDKIKKYIFDSYHMITFIGLFTSPFFNFVFKNFNILIINRLRYSYRNKLKFIYVKEFKNIFDEFDDLKCWLNKKRTKNGLCIILTLKPSKHLILMILKTMIIIFISLPMNFI